MKDIKIKKENPKYIKQIKQEDKLSLRKPNQAVYHVKSAIQDKNNKKDDATENYAVNKVNLQSRKTIYNSVHYMGLIHNLRKNRGKSNTINEKGVHAADTTSKDDEKTDNQLLLNNKHKIYIQNNNRMPMTTLTKQDISVTDNHRRDILRGGSGLAYHSFNNDTRRFLFTSKKMKEIQAKNNLYNIKSTIKNALKKTFTYVRKSYFTIYKTVNMISFSVFIISLVLFMGVFMVFADEGTIEVNKEPISEEVTRYYDIIEKYCKQYDIEQYITLIEAIMMEETKGKGNDPMNASELYPNIHILGSEHSIELGIKYFTDCLQKAKVSGIEDTQHLYIAIQGYDFGVEYIDWAYKNFGGYTRASAQVYSKEMKLRNGSGEYVEHVLRYYHVADGKIVQIALSQLGNIGGQPYWSWYGFDQRVEWCACFVSWVANEAGYIDQGLVPKFSYCPSGVQWFKEKNRWAGSGITPEPGYIIFFDFNQDGISDHVGIVEYIQNNVIHTIEGNSIGDECRQRNYDIKSDYIFGYGVVK